MELLHKNNETFNSMVEKTTSTLIQIVIKTFYFHLFLLFF